MAQLSHSTKITRLLIVLCSACPMRLAARIRVNSRILTPPSMGTRTPRARLATIGEFGLRFDLSAGDRSYPADSLTTADKGAYQSMAGLASAAELQDPPNGWAALPNLLCP